MEKFKGLARGQIARPAFGDDEGLMQEKSKKGTTTNAPLQPRPTRGSKCATSTAPVEPGWTKDSQGANSTSSKVCAPVLL